VVDSSLESEHQTDFSVDTTEIARKVLLTMSRHGIPVTPENYQVWFEYTIGSRPELNEEIDRTITDDAKFDEARNRQIHDKYFGQGQYRRLIEEVSHATFRILKEALEGVIATGTVTKDYAQRLNGFATRLEQEDPDPSVLKGMIEEVILDTRRVEESSSELSQQLEKAKEETNELRKRLESAEREATRDVLTGLYNRKYLDTALKALHGQYEKTGAMFSVIMMDIDHFKKINDKYGHKVGDKVLEFIGQTLTGSVKGRDVPARYGGEEFIVLLPATGREDACKLAESIRRQVSGKRLKITKTQESIGVVRLSCGVAQVCEGDTPDSLVDRADQALYLAKESGRDNVKSERDLPPEPQPTEASASVG
jgi:diguanylate cyclase